MIEFAEFPKIARLNRECVVTEKIDGTNAQVIIDKDGDIGAGSRTRLITPQDDNFGFAKWVHDNKEDLLSLGPGHHYGEWWGSGIQRGYGLQKGEKRFSLFNVHRWREENRPKCCHVVPTLFIGLFNTDTIKFHIETLKSTGSIANPGFMKPEGVIVYHIAANLYFKATIEKDDEWKGKK